MIDKSTAVATDDDDTSAYCGTCGMTHANPPCQEKESPVKVDPLFAHLYEPAKDGINPLAKALGNRYKPPKQFPHGDWVSVAKLGCQGSDNEFVEVFESRMPAQFYKVVIHRTNDRPPVEMSTGSGNDMGRLAALLALSAAEGMVGFA